MLELYTLLHEHVWRQLTVTCGLSELETAAIPRYVPYGHLDARRAAIPGLTDARLRTAIGKACEATGTPSFLAHRPRRRRGSLYYKRTGSPAQVAELLGDSKRVAAEHYVRAHRLPRGRPLDRARPRLRPAQRFTELTLNLNVAR